MSDGLSKIPNIIQHIKWLAAEKQAVSFDSAYQYENRNSFQATLDTLYAELANPLLIAVCGEIGNNSFDHNLGNWHDIVGVYFQLIKPENIVILADRGQGVRKTLSRILPDLPSDLEAVKTAFTSVISGRSPEQRGNGLKFVASVVIKQGWEMHFHSGRGLVQIINGKISFSEAADNVKGCLAVLKYS